jgi:hypothetical protein
MEYLFIFREGQRPDAVMAQVKVVTRGKFINALACL